MDLYAILEVRRDATEAEIKRAYRKQAIKWHPDKNPGNSEEAEVRFKFIAEAYEILSDGEKRMTYDQYGIDAVREGANGGSGGFHRGAGGFHVDPFELFRTFFGGNDPFSDPFFSDSGFGAFGGRSPAGFGAGPSMFGGGFGMGGGGSPFDSMFQQMAGGGGPMGGMSSNFTSMSSTMMGGGMGGGGVSRSTSTSTVIQNGRRVTKTTTTIRHADGRVETSTDEQVEEGGSDSFLQGAFRSNGGGSSFLGW